MSEIIPLGSWVDHGVKYLLDHDASTFDAIGKVIESFAALVEHGLQAIPMWAMMAIFVGIGLWRVGWRFSLFTLLSLLLIYATGFWDEMVITLGLTLSATLISLLLGIPLGIWTAKSKTVETMVRPVLDLMQTMPAFVYLIPAAMLFGLGRVPGILGLARARLRR
jgi:glycine betaine/proline transport system permease protein